MSADTKKTIQDTKELFKRIVREADEAGKRVGGLDGDLAKKIHRVKEGGGEVVKHIEERSGK